MQDQVFLHLNTATYRIAALARQRNRSAFPLDLRRLCFWPVSAPGALSSRLRTDPTQTLELLITDATPPSNGKPEPNYEATPLGDAHDIRPPSPTSLSDSNLQGIGVLATCFAVPNVVFINSAAAFLSTSHPFEHLRLPVPRPGSRPNRLPPCWKDS